MKNQQLELAADPARLRELASYEILDTESEQEFDEIVEMASAVAGMPMSLITFVDKSRQWFKARVGIGESETPIQESFCAHAIADKNGYMIVENATMDRRFKKNKYVLDEPNVRFYAGFPLVSPRGFKLGTLCVIDNKPNTLSPEQIHYLQLLSNQAMKMLELHIVNRKLVTLREKETEQRRALASMVESQKRILTILAHDTRGNLYATGQILDLFNEKLIKPEEGEKFFSIMKEQNDSSLKIVEGLVAWGEMQFKARARTEPFCHLTDLVTGVLNTVMLQAEEKKISLNQDIEHVCLDANPEALRFVIRNLVTNALKFTENGSVTVTGKRNHDNYWITISDTGKGMSKQDISKLFGEGVVSTPGTRKEKGIGLGLTLVLNTVRELGWNLDVQSEPGKWTRVALQIPMSA